MYEKFLPFLLQLLAVNFSLVMSLVVNLTLTNESANHKVEKMDGPQSKSDQTKELGHNYRAVISH